jgi:prepilin-type N-terminal cleavage/methylation domain-containing protein
MGTTMHIRREHGRRQAFSLAELMVVVGIIGLLTALALPSFVHARVKSQRNICIENLMQIASAKDRYAMDMSGLSPQSVTNLVPQYLFKVPKCPAGGAYALGELQADPSCSLGPTHNHKL